MCDVISHDSDVLPRSRMPVRIVVSLFRAFVTASVSVWILTRVNGRTVAESLVVVQDLIGREKT